MEEDRLNESEELRQLFGELVITRGLATQAQVQECLAEQAKLQSGGVLKNLGEILVDHGVMTRGQVADLLREQDTAIASCPTCHARYNVLRPWMGKAKCPVDAALLQPVFQSGNIGVVATVRPDDTVSVGAEFGGCRILELLGRGAMGSVYKAKHIGLNRLVALKMRRCDSGQKDVVERLLQEARAIAKLEHPNIVQVYNVGYEKGHFYIVMQLLSGRTLQDRVEGEGVLSVPETLRIVRGVASGLVAAHEKEIIHRDLKLANVILTEDGQVRLTDFGLALDRQKSVGDVGLVVGTPYYISPEQWNGGAADPRSDLYALGVMMFIMVTGQRPYEGKTVDVVMRQHVGSPVPSPRKLNPQLPEGMAAVIQKLMAKKPERRYPDVQALLADLQRLEQGEDPEAVREFGSYVKCGFCDSLEPASAKKCSVCGEAIGQKTGPLEFALRSDEFPCPGCRRTLQKGTRQCTACGILLCRRCGRHRAGSTGFCGECSRGTARR